MAHAEGQRSCKAQAPNYLARPLGDCFTRVVELGEDPVAASLELEA